jgi:transposase InsO family protein
MWGQVNPITKLSLVSGHRGINSNFQPMNYKAKTKRKHHDAVADNFLNQNFNPVAPKQVWADDVTYFKAGAGWMYLVNTLANSRLAS